MNLATNAQTVIGTGGSRGDFVTVDPNNGSLLLDQSDSILRLRAPKAAASDRLTAPRRPSSLMLFAVGAVGLAIYGWRRKVLKAVSL